MSIKADAQRGAHQRAVAKPAARASEVTRKRGDGCLEKRTTLLTKIGSMKWTSPESMNKTRKLCGKVLINNRFSLWCIESC